MESPVWGAFALCLSFSSKAFHFCITQWKHIPIWRAYCSHSALYACYCEARPQHDENQMRERKKRDDKLMWKLRKVVVFLGTFSRRSNVLNRRFLFLDDCHLLHTIHYTRMWHFSSLPLYAARIQITHSTHHTIYISKAN